MIDIKISTERNDLIFLPLETISGQASWSITGEPKKAEIRLFWYTQGKGDIDIQIIEKIELNQINRCDKTSFSFKLPNEPYSFNGKLISLIWAIEIVFFPSKESFKIDFVVSPIGQEINLHSKITSEPK